MKKVWEWIKSHPLVVVLVIGAGILLLLLSSGNKNSSAYAASGPSDAAVSAAAAIQAQQLQAGTAMAQIQGQVAANANDNATQLAISQLQLQGAQYTTAANAQVALSGISAQQNVQLAGIASQTQLADISRQTAYDQINATVQIAALNSHTYESITNAQAQTEQYRIEAAAYTANAPYITAQKFYETLGSANLEKVITGAEATKGAVLQLPGINVGRVGSAGGTLFGNSSFGNSSAGSVISNIVQTAAYGFQKGLIGMGTF